MVAKPADSLAVVFLLPQATQDFTFVCMATCVGDDFCTCLNMSAHLYAYRLCSQASAGLLL